MGRAGLRRAAVTGLCVAGVADALYMLAYQKGWIGSMACPFFGEGCETVARSPQARLLGVSTAALGALGNATMAGAGPRRPPGARAPEGLRPPWSRSRPLRARSAAAR